MPRPLPTGVVTFMFTDIEGSTRLLRAHPEGYAEILRDHHRILDECVGTEDGIRMSDEGDGGFFVFPTAGGAIAAALMATEGMERHAWPEGARVRVRMGIHSGDATITPDGRYVGLNVHLAARVAAAGHGGQILATATTVELARCPAEISTTELGHYALADFPDPVEIIQLGPGTFPPLRAEPPSTLPVALGPTLGRGSEIDAISRLVADHRLVTILGPGGTGKTRLAVEVGTRLRSSGRPVYFVDLSQIEDPALIPARVAATLGIPEDPGVEPIRRIAHAVGKQSGTLILDNCEHLVPNVSRVALSILATDERTHILSTSRSPLAVPGEQLFELGPLEVQAEGDEIAPALRLFFDRAEAVGSPLVESADTVETVRSICERLDGLPLAIELAASMTRLLDVDQLAGLVARRLDVLQGGAAFPDRHQSLAATLAWSVELLAEDVRASFFRLGVMRGPFGLEDAAAVMERDLPDAITVMGSLCDQALVRRTDARAGRFRLLETIRWFALEHLEASGEPARAHDRHLERYRRLGVDVRARLRRSEGRRVLLDTWPIRSNLIAALDHAIAVDDLGAAMDIVEGLIDMWAVKATAREARLVTTRLVTAIGDSDPALQARALAAKIEVRQAAGVGKPPEPGPPDQLLELAGVLDDPRLALRATIWRAAAGRIPAQQAHEALVALEEMGDYRGTVLGLEALGWLWLWTARQDRAKETFERMYSLAARRGDFVGLFAAVPGIAASAMTEEQIDRARELGDELDPLARDVGATWWHSLRFQFRAHPAASASSEEAAEWLERAYRLACDRGTIEQVAFVVSDQVTEAWNRADYEAAYAKLREFGTTYFESDEAPTNPFLPEMAGAIAAAWEMDEDAARLLGVGAAWRAPGGLTDQGMPMPDWDLPRQRHVLNVLRSRLGGRRLEQLLEEGGRLDPGAAVSLAMGLVPPRQHSATEAARSGAVSPA